MQVEYMSFSAHADAKGIMQLVGQAEPEHVLLVHGEAKKMEFLKQKIEQEFRRQPGWVGLMGAGRDRPQGPCLQAWFETLYPWPGVSCYMPANGETVTLPTSPSIPVGISLGLLKREMAQGMLAGQAGQGGWLLSSGLPCWQLQSLLPSLQDCILMQKSPDSCMAP